VILVEASGLPEWGHRTKSGTGWGGFAYGGQDMKVKAKTILPILPILFLSFA
jgi:hypothetical protein